MVWILEKFIPNKTEVIKGDILTDPYAHCAEQSPAWDEHYNRTIYYVNKVAELCGQYNIKYIATLLPSEAQLKSRRLYKILADSAVQSNFTFWDFSDDFNQSLNSEHYNDMHGHLTPEGNSMLADIFYKKLITENILNDRSIFNQSDGN